MSEAARRETLAIVYALEPELSAQEFRAVLVASTLGERRPVDEPERLERMLRHADLIVTARHDAKLVGVSRAITDFAFCCYLSDLAVEVAYQHQGIGKRLVAETQAAAGAAAMLILIAAPASASYYPKIGMKQMSGCWVIPRSP